MVRLRLAGTSAIQHLADHAEDQCPQGGDAMTADQNTAHQRLRNGRRRSARRMAHRALLLGALVATAASAQATAPAVIEHPGKIGIGTGAWNGVAEAQVVLDVDRLCAAWYYTWQGTPPGIDEFGEGEAIAGAAEFVPMAWGRQAAQWPWLSAIDLASPALLAFNEPDLATQAHMSVNQALAFWPKLEGLSLPLGSPAVSSGGGEPAKFLQPEGWLARFMEEIETRGERVDFMALHYYTTDPNVSRMRRDLARAYARYGRPLWITEWALVDWFNPDRFTMEETTAFMRAAIEMMDDLPFVERHAWFAAYAGGDGWYINTELLDGERRLTLAGRTFRELTGCAP